MTETFQRNIARFFKVGVLFVVLFKWVQSVGNLARMIKIIGGTINTKLSILCNKKKLNYSLQNCVYFLRKACRLLYCLRGTIFRKFI